jgi:surfactin family lipopeptide synthetase C
MSTLVDNENIYDLTPTQQAMLLYALYAPASQAYFEQVTYSYHGPLNVPAFISAWQRIIDRYAILRTSFCWDNGERPVQTVHSQVELPFEQRDWRDVPTLNQQQQLASFLEEDRNRGFDLAKAPLIRLTLIQTAEDTFKIVISNHHIVLDGWSMGLVRSEVSKIYQALSRGEEIDLPPAPPFRDYVEWLQRQNQAGAEFFWRRELKGFAAPNSLPIDHAPGRLPDPNDVFAEQQVNLPAGLSAELQACARRYRLTMSTIAQAAWGVLLSRYCNSDDVTFGITVSGRPYDLPGIEAMVGVLINTLPVRVQISPAESAGSCFQKLQRKVAEVREHEYLSLKQIQDWSEVPRTLPLFESLVVFENFAGHDAQFELSGEIEISNSYLARTNYPLTLVINPSSELELRLIYHRSRFDDDAIQRMLGHLVTIFESFVASLERPVATVNLLSEGEHEQLVEWSRSAVPAPDVQPIHRRIEHQAARTPDAIAVEQEGQRLTYSELNARANQLARCLGAAGAGRESLVGICLERSLDMIVAVLAVLKAGGAYVPLDPAYPKDRLAFMLDDSGAGVLLTRESLRDRALEFNGRVISVDTEAKAIAALSDEDLIESATSKDPAFVIYTSGSTGKPKGVVIEHQALTNFALGAAEEYEINQNDRVLQFASLCFDLSVEEIFCALAHGATLILRNDAMLTSAEQFLRSCTEFEITVLDLPTAYWHYLTSEICADNLPIPESLRLVILGGEQVQSDRVASWLEHSGERVRLVNTYGPTEATVVTTTCELSGRTAPLRVPIGRPVRGAEVYVLDRALQPVPVGIPGELFIGGAVVARGYLNRPQLTAERFIANPFVDGARLYRTGDSVRYLSDGNLEFLGRLDNQVKIRGFRVELEEIEQAIRGHQSVSDAVVTVREDGDGDKRLFAYVVPAGGSQPTAGELRSFVKGSLPPYMLPAAFVIVQTLPLMPNGKVDRQALPAPENERPEINEDFVAPRTPTEEFVSQTWLDALKLDRAGIHDNFFELGGHSLLAARMFSDLRKRFGVELNLIDIFNAPTIAELAEMIYQRETEQAKSDDLMSLLSELQGLSDEEASLRVGEELITADSAKQQTVGF